MGHGGVDGDDEVEAGDEAGGFGEVGEAGAGVEKRPPPGRPAAGTGEQTDPEDRGREQSGKALDRYGAVGVVVVLGVAGPHYAHPQAAGGRAGDLLPPGGRDGGRRFDVGDGGGDGDVFGGENGRQAVEGAGKVKLPRVKGPAVVADGEGGLAVPEQAGQRLLQPDGCRGSQASDLEGIADKLEGVAEALLVVEEDAAAGKILAPPGGDGQAEAALEGEAGFEERPAFGELPLNKVKSGQRVAGFGQVGVEVDGPQVGGLGVAEAAGGFEAVAEVVVGGDVVALLGDSLAEALFGLGQALEVFQGDAEVVVGFGINGPQFDGPAE